LGPVKERKSQPKEEGRSEGTRRVLAILGIEAPGGEEAEKTGRAWNRWEPKSAV